MNSTGHIRRLAIDTLVSDLLFLGYMPKSNLLFFAGEKRREEEKGKTISSHVLPAIASILPYNLSYIHAVHKVHWLHLQTRIRNESNMPNPSTVGSNAAAVNREKLVLRIYALEFT